VSTRRLADIPAFSIDLVAAAAGDDPEVLRLENLDTDIPPPAVAVAATQSAAGSRAANSYLPFGGTLQLRTAVADRLQHQTGHPYSPDNVVVTCGATEGMVDVLLATIDPGDEVILTDPTYAGMINRVRLVGGIPRFVPLVVSGGEWRLDLDALQSSINGRTRAIFLMNPSMPSGAVLIRHEWDFIANLCRERSLWLIYNAAMERILFDHRAYLHPAALPDMEQWTITVGSVSKEFRMIGWRVGWIVAPQTVIGDIQRAHIYNVVTPVGITQAGALAALRLPAEEIEPAIAEWQRRRDVVLEQLTGYPVTSAQGGWSLLLNVAELGFDAVAACMRLLNRGKIAATPMLHWGTRDADRMVRLVFSNEPVERLCELRSRVQSAME
jgi:aspartate/methionine/tyrosine aminotransferase